MDARYVLGLSILFQLASTVLAIRLVRVTGGRWAWGLIALAIALMALRRSITCYRVVSSGLVVSANLMEEWVALMISVLIFCGVTSISPFFASIRRPEGAQRESQSRLFAVLENVADGIITINGQGAGSSWDLSALR